MDEINVISRTQQITVEPVSNSVAIINAGPPGPGLVSGVPANTYTPVLGGGWALGSGGSVVGTYVDVGHWILLHIELRFGTTMVQGASGLTLTTPVQALPSGKGFHGTGQLQDTSVPAYFALSANIWSGGPIEVYVLTSSGAYVGYVPLTTGIPFVWTNNDYVELDIAYQTAA